MEGRGWNAETRATGQKEAGLVSGWSHGETSCVLPDAWGGAGCSRPEAQLSAMRAFAEALQAGDVAAPGLWRGGTHRRC